MEQDYKKMMTINQNIKNLINEVSAPASLIEEEVEPTDTRDYGTSFDPKDEDTPHMTPTK